MAVTNDPQHSIYETTIENDTLATALDERAELRQTKLEATKAFNDADKSVKQQIDALDLGVGAPVRIGNYVVSVKETKGRSVAFETEPSTKIQISLLDQD